MQSQDGATYRRNQLHIRPTMIEAVIRDKSPVRFESKRRQAETSYEEKTTTSHEPFIMTGEKTLYNSNSTVPTNLPRENRELLKNSMQETPADVEQETIPLRQSSRIRKEPERLKTLFVTDRAIHLNITIHFGQLRSKHSKFLLRHFI